jgi:hypothetical protein
VTSEEKIEVLRELVEEQEAELHVAVEELEVAARRSIDARNWIRHRPFAWTAGAFLVGAWLGGHRT